MSCKDCSDECRQGRDCPLRKTPDVPLYRIYAFASVAIGLLIYIAFVYNDLG